MMEFTMNDLEEMGMGDVPRDADSAAAWLRVLEGSTASYHIDDDPREVINMTSGRRLFNEEAASHASKCLGACAEWLGSWEKVWEAYYPLEE